MKEYGTYSLKKCISSSLLILFIFAMTTMNVSANTPNTVTGLQNITYAQNHINWTWIDPPQGYDFYVQVYINGTWKENVIKGRMYYNATGLSPNTNYEIGTRVVETSHYHASSWNNHTARTAPSVPIVDNTPPVTTINRAGDYKTGNWFASPVDITFTATDDISGVQKTEYRLATSGDWTVYTGLFTISTEGDTPIQYRSIDNTNNVEAIKYSQVKIDTIFPVITVTGVTNGATYNTNVTPTITVTDTNIASWSSLLNGAPYTSGTEISQNGNYWLNTTATDIVDHIEYSNISFTIDKTTPPQPPQGTCNGNQTNPCSFGINYNIS